MALNSLAFHFAFFSLSDFYVLPHPPTPLPLPSPTPHPPSIPHPQSSSNWLDVFPLRVAPFGASRSWSINAIRSCCWIESTLRPRLSCYLFIYFSLFFLFWSKVTKSSPRHFTSFGARRDRSSARITSSASQLYEWVSVYTHTHSVVKSCNGGFAVREFLFPGGYLRSPRSVGRMAGRTDGRSVGRHLTGPILEPNRALMYWSARVIITNGLCHNDIELLYYVQ